MEGASVGIGVSSREKRITEYGLEEAVVKRALLESFGQTIVVVGGNKYGSVTFASVASLPG